MGWQSLWELAVLFNTRYGQGALGRVDAEASNKCWNLGLVTLTPGIQEKTPAVQQEDTVGDGGEEGLQLAEAEGKGR